MYVGDETDFTADENLDIIKDVAVMNKFKYR